MQGEREGEREIGIEGESERARERESERARERENERARELIMLTHFKLKIKTMYT